MRALIIYAHPDSKSFNRAILSTVVNTFNEKKIEFKIRDLYQKRFSPVLEISDFREIMSGIIPFDIAKEQQDITWADMLVFIFPIWWWGVPAVLKGWIDKVFFNIQPLLTDKRALVLTTCGSSQETAEQHGLYKSMENLFKYGIFGFVGIKDVRFKNLYAVTSVGDEERIDMLKEVSKFIKSLQ